MPTVLNSRHPSPSPIAPASSPRQRTFHLEVGLAIACMILFAAGAWGPSVSQPAHYHTFADQRGWLGIPHVMDVLSNMAFAAFGAVGLWCIRQLPPEGLGRVQRHLAQLFFFGLVATALLSAWYHLHPDDEGLAMDRHGMTIAFAGLLGLAASTRISDRAGNMLTLAVLVTGAWSIMTWSSLGNAFPWAVLQFGGMALMLCMAGLPARADTLLVPWIKVLMIYGLAKWLEHHDEQVYHLSRGWISGHTLKHLVASCAALPVLIALASRVSCHREAAIANAPLVAKQ